MKEVEKEEKQVAESTPSEKTEVPKQSQEESHA